MRKITDLSTHFWGKVDIKGPQDCWVWKGYCTKYGYGQLFIHRKSFLAHRYSYTINKGEIPDNMMVCHKCDNPPCVNPNHLFIGTHQDNMDDMINKGRANHKHGDENGNAKLTWEQVFEIRELYRQGLSKSKLSRRFGMGFSAISCIVDNSSWREMSNG